MPFMYLENSILIGLYYAVEIKEVGFIPLILSAGIFLLQETLGNVWRHFCCHSWGGDTTGV